MIRFRYFLPVVEKITVGIFEDEIGMLYSPGELFPAIVFSYNNERITRLMLNWVNELGVGREDLALVNFEELKDSRVNVVVCFKIRRREKEWVLIAEVEVDKKIIAEFKRYFQERKSFIICFGLYRPEEVNVKMLVSDWYVITNHYTEYDEKSLLDYYFALGGRK